MDQHTESGWKHDPTAPREKCEMNFRNNLTTFSWKSLVDSVQVLGVVNYPNNDGFASGPVRSRTPFERDRFVSYLYHSRINLGEHSQNSHIWGLTTDIGFR